MLFPKKHEKDFRSAHDNALVWCYDAIKENSSNNKN